MEAVGLKILWYDRGELALVVLLRRVDILMAAAQMGGEVGREWESG